MIILCAIAICLFRFSDLKGYIFASPLEIIHWFPAFGKNWLAIRSGIIPALTSLLVFSIFGYVIQDIKLLKGCWLIIRIAVYSVMLYLVFWVGWLVVLLVLAIPYLVLRFRYPIKLALLKKSFCNICKKNQNILLAVGSLFFTLFFVEIWLRHTGINDCYLERNGGWYYNSPYNVANEKGWYHVHRINLNNETYKCKEYTYKYSTNSLGLADKEWSLKKKKRRILCIGDSFTEGLGSTGDSTFEHLLAWGSDSLEVMNCGVAGSDPVFEYRLLADRLCKYEPDVVFEFINSSDIGDVIVRGGFERFGADSSTHFKPAPWWENIYAHSYIARLIIRNGLHLNSLYLSEDENRKATQQAIETLDSCVDKFQTLCNQKGIRCVFVFQPAYFDFGLGKPECQPLIKYADSRKYEAIDLFDFFEKNGVTAQNAGNYFWPIDNHNNNTGYALFAKAVKSKL